MLEKNGWVRIQAIREAATTVALTSLYPWWSTLNLLRYPFPAKDRHNGHQGSWSVSSVMLM